MLVAIFGTELIFLSITTRFLPYQTTVRYADKGAIRFDVTEHWEKSGFVEVKLYNDTAQGFGYTYSPLYLEESWLGVFWVPYFSISASIKSLVGITPRFGWPLVNSGLPAGKSVESVLPLSPLKNDPALPGRYRVCFHYFIESPETKRKVCSGAFWLASSFPSNKGVL